MGVVMLDANRLLALLGDALPAVWTDRPSLRRNDDGSLCVSICPGPGGPMWFILTADDERSMAETVAEAILGRLRSLYPLLMYPVAVDEAHRAAALSTEWRRGSTCTAVLAVLRDNATIVDRAWLDHHWRLVVDAIGGGLPPMPEDRRGMKFEALVSGYASFGAIAADALRMIEARRS